MADTVREERDELRRTCRWLGGHGPSDPVAELERVAALSRAQQAGPDVYGQGALVQAFEQQVAALRGYHAARFMPSGTMAQPIALRLWSERSGRSHVAMHPTCHMELHEQHGYRHLHCLQSTLLGSADRPLLARDLDDLEADVSTLVVELPTRENGGQLPTWAELVALVEAARARGIRLHLDGARLWEVQAYYERPLAEICSHFDSAYVSFYKGIGALAGAMLLGPADWIEEAVIWQRRQGGNLYSLHPNVASAAMRLAPQLARMPAYRAHALELAAALAPIDGLRVLPNPPQVNMFHVGLPLAPESADKARDRVARETGLWLFGAARADVDPGTSRFELYVGEATLALPVDDVAAAFRLLLAP